MHSTQYSTPCMFYVPRSVTAVFRAVNVGLLFIKNKAVYVKHCQKRSRVKNVFVELFLFLN